MISQVEAGHTVLVPEGNGGDVRLVSATVPELRAALTAIAPSMQPQIPPPNDYPIRGKGCNPVTSRPPEVVGVMVPDAVPDRRGIL